MLANVFHTYMYVCIPIYVYMYCSDTYTDKTCIHVTDQMNQQARACSVLAEDLISVPSPQIWWLTTNCNFSSLPVFSGISVYMHKSSHKHTCICVLRNIEIHRKKYIHIQSLKPYKLAQLFL